MWNHRATFPCYLPVHYVMQLLCIRVARASQRDHWHPYRFHFIWVLATKVLSLATLRYGLLEKRTSATLRDRGYVAGGRFPGYITERRGAGRDNSLAAHLQTSHGVHLVAATIYTLIRFPLGRHNYIHQAQMKALAHIRVFNAVGVFFAE